ncbi:MAG: glycosyltransferase family 1 protein [Hahellaceae bacterium]|nr:glycosyltransferase family 1 protein [Hahellaceae bacterium]MCP5211737.1 glycosyltransferase family 1 protein [Hahellaceae bacterium]
MNETHKPRLLIFGQTHHQLLPHFRSGHIDYLTKALSYHFHLTEISIDCDYRQVVDKHKPDCILFDGGILHSQEKPFIKLRNFDHHCKIPKAGIIRVDAISAEMHLVLEYFDQFGIARFFAIDTGLGEAWPHLKKSIIYWPWSFDNEIYKDYGLEKTIPISMIGEGFSTQSPYLWRKAMFDQLTRYFPIFISNRPRKNSPVNIHTEQYAKILNQSWLAFGCGCERFILTRKLFEIPASKALLVTEKSDVLISAGFSDGKNCIFVDRENVLDKLETIFEDFDSLKNMTLAGHQLIYKKHDFSARTQILDWFHLREQGVSEDNIMQDTPFSSLTSKVNRSTPLNATQLHTGTESLLSVIRYDIITAIHNKSLTQLLSCQKRLKDLYPTFFESLPDFRLIQTISDIISGQIPEAIKHFCQLLSITDVYGYKRLSLSRLEHFLLLWLAKFQSNQMAISWYFSTYLHPANSHRFMGKYNQIAFFDKSTLWDYVESLFSDEASSDISEHPLFKIIYRSKRQELDAWFESVATCYKKNENSKSLKPPIKGIQTVIFGLGEISFKVYDDLIKTNEKVQVFIHNFSREETTCKGIPTYLPEDLALEEVDNIVITNRTYQETALQLILLGASENSISVLERTSGNIVPLVEIMTVTKN